MQNLRKNLFKGLRKDFFNNSFKVALGSVISQSLIVLSLPIISRLYSPAEYGFFASFLALTASFGSIACLRFDVAIMQAKDRIESLHIFYTSMNYLLIVCSVLGVVSYILSQFIDIQFPGYYLFLFPLSLSLIGCIQALTVFFNRREQFYLGAVAKVIASASMIILQLTLVFLSSSPEILVIAFIIGNFLSVIYLVYFFNSDFSYFSFLSSNLFFKVSRKYKDYPIFSSIGSLADSLSLNLPILYVAYFFSLEVAGAFAIAYRIINIPIAFVGQAISQVFYRNTIEKKDRIYILRTTLLLAALLALIFLPFLLLVVYFGEPLLEFIFSEKWSLVGKIALYIIFAGFVRFSISPLSSILLAPTNLRLGVIWQILYLSTLSSTFFLLINSEFEKFLLFFTLHEVILYIIYFVFIFKGAINLKYKD